MEIRKPNLIIEWDGDSLTKGMCSACRAVFPTLEGNGTEANKQLLESFFQVHIKAEHSDQPPPSEGT